MCHHGTVQFSRLSRFAAHLRRDEPPAKSDCFASSLPRPVPDPYPPPQTARQEDYLSIGGRHTGRGSGNREGSSSARHHSHQPRDALERRWLRALALGVEGSSAASATAGTATGGWARGVAPEVRALEDAIASTLGARKRNRWQNDRLLRDLAGPLSARDARSLFEPAPFGGGRACPFATAANRHAAEGVPGAAGGVPANALPSWGHLMHVDPDAEREALRAWDAAEELKREERRAERGRRWAAHAAADVYGDEAAGPSAQSTVATPTEADASRAAADALGRWRRLPRPQRAALRGADPAMLARLERPVARAGAMLRGEGGMGGYPIDTGPSSCPSSAPPRAALLPQPNPYSRLLTHALAAYHGLDSRSPPKGGAMPRGVIVELADPPGGSGREGGVGAELAGSSAATAAAPPPSVAAAEVVDLLSGGGGGGLALWAGGGNGEEEMEVLPLTALPDAPGCPLRAAEGSVPVVTAPRDIPRAAMLPLEDPVVIAAHAMPETTTTPADEARARRAAAAETRLARAAN